MGVWETALRAPVRCCFHRSLLRREEQAFSICGMLWDAALHRCIAAPASPCPPHSFAPSPLAFMSGKVHTAAAAASGTPKSRSETCTKKGVAGTSGAEMQGSCHSWIATDQCKCSSRQKAARRTCVVTPSHDALRCLPA